MKMRSLLSSYAWAPAAVDPAVKGTADAEIKVASLLRTPELSKAVSLKRAWSVGQITTVHALPAVRNNLSVSPVRSLNLFLFQIVFQIVFDHKMAYLVQ